MCGFGRHWLACPAKNCHCRASLMLCNHRYHHDIHNSQITHQRASWNFVYAWIKKCKRNVDREEQHSLIKPFLFGLLSTLQTCFLFCLDVRARIRFSADVTVKNIDASNFHPKCMLTVDYLRKRLSVCRAVSIRLSYCLLCTVGSTLFCFPHTVFSLLSGSVSFFDGNYVHESEALFQREYC